LLLPDFVDFSARRIFADVSLAGCKARRRRGKHFFPMKIPKKKSANNLSLFSHPAHAHHTEDESKSKLFFSLSPRSASNNKTEQGAEEERKFPKEEKKILKSILISRFRFPSRKRKKKKEKTRRRRQKLNCFPFFSPFKPPKPYISLSEGRRRRRKC
jgi:hypothetical protein